MQAPAIRLQPLNPKEKAMHERAVLRAKTYLRDEAQLLESIEEVDRERLFEKLGYTWISEYCRKELKLSETIAGYFVAVAHKSRKVPELKEAVMEGAFGVSTAIQICAVLTSENQAEWIQNAKELPKSELEKKVAEANPKKAKRASAKPVGKDRNRVQFEEDDEFMKLLKRAQDIESQRKSQSAKIGETLRAALEDYLDKHDPVRRAERAQKKAQPQQPAPKPGRHRIPAALQHQVNLRDRGRCQIANPDGQKCGSSRWTQTHHIRAVEAGGLNVLDNLVTVCSAHHRMLHPESQLKH